MMKIAREKLAASWTVVKGNRYPEEISFKVLQMYRPLFKYLSGREIARLNLNDTNILTYIGTHAELDRHQVSSWKKSKATHSIRIGTNTHERSRISVYYEAFAK